MGRTGVSLVAVCCVVFAGSAARAQGTDDRPGKQKRADELFEQGRKLLNGTPADPQGACDKFNEAIKLDPEAPGTMLNLGLCNEKLSKFKTALYWFRKAQARAAETNLPDYEKAAKDHTVDLAGKVATIKITFTTPATDAKVKIDNEDVKPDEYLHAEVDPGRHTLVAGAPGKKIVQQEFEVEGRGGQTLTIELVEGTNTVVIDRGAGRRKAALILAVGGGVMWGAALGVSLWARGNYNDYAKDGMTLPTDKLPMCGAATCTQQEATDKANHYQAIARWVATPIFVGGALAIGGSILLYLTAPDKERIDRTVFAPTLGPDHIGFAFSGGF